jgi:type II secretory pathway predicted ATPase ExeA
MYLDFFKLQRLPFRLTADPAFHFLAGERAVAKAQIKRAVELSEGCVLIVGEAGIGKTVMLEDCLAQLPDTVKLAHVRHADLSSAEFFEAVLSKLESTDQADSVGARLRFDACLAKQVSAGFQVLIAVDNADLVASDLLDEILKLASRRRTPQLRCCVLLSARPSLQRILARPQFDTADKRPVLQILLQPFDLEETQRYLDHRLQVSGFAGQEFFGADACGEVLRFTGGIPRLMNTLADAVLMAAFTRGHGRVSASDVKTVASQLGWVEYSARPEGDLPRAEIELSSPGYIKLDHQNRRVAECQLPLGKITLGRALRNDVRIESSFVSREHCRILTTANSSVIEDLQSQNGLLINGKKLSVHRLSDGDVIQIGDHFLTYVKGVMPAASLPEVLREAPRALGSETVQTTVLTPADTIVDVSGVR